jgi:hypothetical protein
MSDSDQPGTPPAKPRPKVHLGLPDGYWSWPDAKKREWAQEAAKSLQARLLGSTVPEPELSPAKKPGG